MLTSAIGFVQNVQLVCFAVIFVLMARQDRRNGCLRWLAAGYLCGAVGAVFDLADPLLPHWLGWTIGCVAAPAAYGCLHAGMVEFLGRGRHSRWASVAICAACLALFPLWAQEPGGIDRITSFEDLCLGVQTALSAWVLLGAREDETVWPRRVMGAFLSAYAAVELARVAVFALTGRTPDSVAPWIEVASGVVYVVSCSVLPLGFIWMMNARLHAHMARQVTTDPLTEILNRRGLQMAAEVELARYGNGRQDFALVLADIDHFKRLNDVYGHAGGDQVLRDLAALFRAVARESDAVGRLGGEEFVLLLPGMQSAGAVRLVERLREATQRMRILLGEGDVALTVSYGVTVSAGRSGLSWKMLLEEADEALYAAKNGGRDRCVVYAGVAQIEAPGFEALLGTA